MACTTILEGTNGDKARGKRGSRTDGKGRIIEYTRKGTF